MCKRHHHLPSAQRRGGGRCAGAQQREDAKRVELSSFCVVELFLGGGDIPGVCYLLLLSCYIRPEAAAAAILQIALSRLRPAWPAIAGLPFLLPPMIYLVPVSIPNCDAPHRTNPSKTSSIQYLCTLQIRCQEDSSCRMLSILLPGLRLIYILFSRLRALYLVLLFLYFLLLYITLAAPLYPHSFTLLYTFSSCVPTDTLSTPRSTPCLCSPLSPLCIHIPNT